MNGLRNSIFNKVFDKCEKNVITKRIMYFTIEIGFGDCIYRLFSKKYLENRKKFYTENKERIEKNIEILEDEISKETYIKMIEYRCKRERHNFPKYNSKNIYFSEDIIKINEKETFIDCGAYIGDTVEDFIFFSNGKYDNIIAFEPDVENFKILSENVKKYKNITVYQYGVWNDCGNLNFDDGNVLGSSIREDGNNQIKTINLDSIKECHNASFIKMDIEGAELEALKGAENILKKNKPKLAICIYHSDQDMIDIIEYINKLNLGYKIYLRQHGLNEADTVIYCI